MTAILIKILIGIVSTMAIWLIERIIVFINGKIKNDKVRRFLKGASDIVLNAVKSTYQDYVEGLKKAGTFTEDAQKRALENAKSKIRLEMSVGMRQYIEENVGDFETWLYTSIHSALYDLKR